MLGKAKLTRNWTVGANIRITAPADVPAVAGWWGFKTKTQMMASGWTHVWSCDGTTGPANAADHTDRITDESKFKTRSTVANAPHSWWVLRNALGAQVLAEYFGGGEDQIRLSLSIGGLYTLAATTTHRPTASDELVAVENTNILHVGAAGDRVMHIWTTDRMFGFVIWRALSMTNFISPSWEVDPLSPASVLPVPLVTIKLDMGWRNNAGSWISGMYDNQALGSAGFRGFGARVFTGNAWRNLRLLSMAHAFPNGPGFTSNIASNVSLGANHPPLQGGIAMPLFPVILLGANTIDEQGILGSLVDVWAGLGVGGSPGPTDSCPALDASDPDGALPRTNWLRAPGHVGFLPWRNASPNYEIT